VACMGAYRTAQIVLVTESEAKRYLGRPTFSWEDNIEIYRKRYDGRKWATLMWLRKETICNPVLT